MPIILALGKYSVLGYAFTIILGWSVEPLHRPEPLFALLLVLAAIVMVARRYRHTGMWGLLVLTHLLAEGVAIIAFGHQAGLQWVLPTSYLIPLATSPARLTRHDFCIAMALCTTGPIVALLTTPEPASAIHHSWLGPVFYLPICVAAAAAVHHYLLRAMARHFAVERSLVDRVNTDHLTGTFTRQRFFELDSFTVERAQHHIEPLYASYLDVDHFKSINDVWGHAAGDGALVALSGALADVLRPADLFDRLGGDEFAVLLPGYGLMSALAVVEQLKTAVAGTQTPVRPLTVSVGAAPLRPGQNLARLLANADLGLMEAKRQDRNRVCIPTSVQPPANLQQ